MPGLDDLIGSLTDAKSGGSGVEDVLGGILGGSGGGGGLGDVLGGLLGGAQGGAGGSGGGGLGDVLGGLLGGGQGDSGAGSGGGGAGLAGVMSALAPLIVGLLRNGGLSKILSGLQANGLSAEADSWVGTGENAAIDPETVRNALGPEVDQVAEQLGIGQEQAAELLSGILPGLVSTVTPEGQVPGDDEIDRLVDVINGFSS